MIIVVVVVVFVDVVVLIVVVVDVVIFVIVVPVLLHAIVVDELRFTAVGKTKSVAFCLEMLVIIGSGNCGLRKSGILHNNGGSEMLHGG